jgi:hypothetical protein
MMNAFREIAFFAIAGVVAAFAAALLEHYGKISAGNSQILLMIGSGMVTAAVTRWADRKASSLTARNRTTGAYETLEITPQQPGKETNER